VRTAWFTGWTSERDDVVDLERVLVDDDALDEQLQDSLSFSEGGGVQPAADALAEGRQIGEDGLGRESLLAETELLGALRFQALALLGHVLPPLSELCQADDLGLVGVQEPLVGPAEPLEAGGEPAGLRLLRLIPVDGHLREAAELGKEVVRLGQEVADVCPDGRLELRGPHPWAEAVHLAARGEAVLARAVVVAVLRQPHGRAPDVAGHGEAAAAAAQQAAQ